MASFFYSIFRYLRTRRAAFFIAIPLIFALLAYWATRIRFEEDITKLIPTSDDAAQVDAVLRSAKFADKTIVNIAAQSAGDVAALQEYADTLAAMLEREASPYIQRLQVRLDDDQLVDLMDVVYRNLPLFLDSADYVRIDSLLRPDALAVRVQDAYQAAIAPQNLISGPFVRQDPLGLTALGLHKFERLQSDGQFVLQDGYVLAKDRRNLLAFITTAAAAGETARNAEFIAILDRTINRLNARYEGQVSATYFGATAMAVANAQQIKRDIQVTLSIALIALIALFIYFYRRIAIPIIVLVPAAFGSLLGMTVLYAIKGTISAISIGIGSVLLGLTLDYSLHILSHYRGTGDVKRLFESTTKPLLVCAIFTAVDFLCLLFLRSDVLHDLGIFAAVSVLGAAGFALVFIPQVYTPGNDASMRRNTFIDTLARQDLSRNKWVLAVSVSLVVVSLFTFQHVGFNDDLDALNYRPSHLQQAERQLDTLTNHNAKSIYFIAYGDTYDAALARNAALHDRLAIQKARATIHHFQSIGSVAFSAAQQEKKIQQWHAFWSGQRKSELMERLRVEGRRVGFRENAFDPFSASLSQAFTLLDTADEHTLRTLFLDEFIGGSDKLATITTVVRTDPDRAPSVIQSLDSADNGILAIDRKHLQETLLSNLENDFNKLFFIASVAVFIVIFLFFGSLELTLITNIPIFLGWLVTLGLMGAFGIQFNAFNIIITTLIFGLGVDYSIFVTKGLLERYTYGRDDMPAFRAGVLMSALATLICFGILIFAKHPAIRSISIIPLIGLLVVVLMSFSIQPWLFRTFISGPQEKGNTPWRLVNLALTGFTFGYFFIGGMLVSLLGQLLIPILPIGKKKKFRVFHRVLQLFFHNLMYRTPGIRMAIIGREPGLYHPPVILIANHTSILDTPTMGLLHPRQLFMMNDRQLRSPFFGRAMRMVGAHPASENQPENLEKLKKKIEQGYSIIIFPEGTRSMTTEIQRFHKGACYLADALKLDIVPVLVHGNVHALPKYDNMLKPGPITMKYLPRIRHDDATFGTGYAERTKRIARYFRTEFRKLRDEREPADYFYQKIRFNYVYKPARIQREVKAVFKENNARYHRLLRLLPLQGRFFHLGCGYGVLDFLLAYDSAARQVTGWDAVEGHVLAAQHTYTTNRYSVRFVTEIPPLPDCNVLIISASAPMDWQGWPSRAEWVIFDRVGPEKFATFAQADYRLAFQYDGLIGYQRHG